MDCKICNGRKEIEVLVMGTDTEWVECYFCKPDEKIIQRNKKVKNINRRMNHTKNNI